MLTRVRHHVNGYLAKTRISAAELAARQKATEMRLHKVEKESEVIMKKLEKQLDKDIRSVLQGHDARIHIPRAVNVETTSPAVGCPLLFSGGLSARYERFPWTYASYESPFQSGSSSMDHSPA